MEKEDIEQIATEGLIYAVDKFDVSKGYKFSTYAVPCIAGIIRNRWREEEKNNITAKKNDSMRIKQYQDKMLETLGRLPTDEEIKKVLGISDGSFEKLKEYNNYHSRKSLDDINEEMKKEEKEKIERNYLDDERPQEIKRKPILDGVYIDEEDRDVLGEDIRKTDIGAMIETEKEILLELLETLTDREAEVLRLRFGIRDGRQRTLEEVGKVFGRSKDRIREIEVKVLRKLRNPKYKLEDLVTDIDDEEWSNYYDLYDNTRPENEIVDGIKIESYNPSKQKKEVPFMSVPYSNKKIEEYKDIDDREDDMKDKQDENIDEEKSIEELLDEYMGNSEKESIEQPVEDVKIENTENELLDSEKDDSIEQIQDVKKYNSEESYLDEISELLGTLDDLDKMLAQTSKDIKKEKDKKQKNKEVRAKMKQIKGLIDT